MRSHEPAWILQYARDVINVKTGGVRAEDCIGLAVLVKIGKDLLLQINVLIKNVQKIKGVTSVRRV